MNSGATGCTSVSSTPTVTERFVTTSKPSPTMANDSYPFHGDNRSTLTGVTSSSNSLKFSAQKPGSVTSAQKTVNQGAINHIGLHTATGSSAESGDPGTSTTTKMNASGTDAANITAQGGDPNSFHSLEMLFHPANIMTIQPSLGPGKGTPPPIHKLGSMSFLRWASSKLSLFLLFISSSNKSPKLLIRSIIFPPIMM